MSTSSLTSIPPSSQHIAAPSSNTLDIHIPKPAPKRTYGRARPTSPPPITESSSSSSIVPHPRGSPSKALLDRWSAANQSWKDGLWNLDAPSSDKPELEHEEEEDPDAVIREMQRLRKQARMLKNLDNPSTASREPIPLDNGSNTNHTLEVPKNRLGASFSSSSLTSIPTTVPTSPLRSSPPPLRSSPPQPSNRANRKLQAQSSEVAEETAFPVRKSGISGKQRRIVVSDEEDSDGGDPPLFAKDTSRSASPTNDGDLSTTERGSSPPPGYKSNRDLPQDDEEGDNENMADYLNNLAWKEARAAREAEELTQQPKSSALDGLDDLFDNDDDEPQEKKVRASRGLNKAEKAEMEKDIARAQRERPVAFSRPEPSRLPITAWLAQANVAVRTRETIEHRVVAPGLTFAKSPQTSPSQPTPPDDDIIGFTPSSGTRRPLGTTSTSRISIENPNTPTPAPSRQNNPKNKVVVPGTSEGGVSDDEEQDLVKFLDKEKMREQKQAEADAKRKRLEEFKLSMVKQQTAKLNLEPSKPSSSDHEHGEGEEDDDELDFEFDNDLTPKKDNVISTMNIRTGPGAKAVLNKTDNKSTISKQKQGYLARAGKLHKRSKVQDGQDISETYVDFAGKVFSHANQKQLNGGAKPSNQKKGREEVISQDDMSKFIRLKHQQQVIALQKKKEEEYGRVKVLPQRVEHDYEILVESSKEDQDHDRDHNDADEEDEDEDYNPDEEEDEVVWSGEEAEEGSDEEPNGNELLEDVAQEEKENELEPTPLATQEDDEEETTPMIKRKPRASARVAFDSDDEDAQSRIRSSPAHRAPLAEVPAPQPTAKSTQTGDGFGGFDFGAFGDDSGSQGFSQLFDATQAGTQAGGEQDAFAALRAEPVGFFHANAMLPGVDISKTQVERDNNLIAAEIEEAAMERAQELEKPKKQYINDGGFFTQTKPASLPRPTYDEDTQISDSRRQLGGPSDYSIFNGDTPAKTQTQTETQMGTSPLDRRESVVGFGSPTQTQEDTEGSFTRLRRRVSDADEGLSIPLSPTQHVEPEPESGANPGGRSVFDRMMKASSRSEKEREQSKKKLKSRLVDEQAEESDEDNGWAKPFGMEEGEDDDDDDNDGFVEGLVDDQEIDQEEKRRQDELAAEKNRQIQDADDLRLEQEARKITEGQYRTKRRGKDFFDDDDNSDDENNGKRRKLSKKQRRKRMLDREDGLDKLEGEANVFRQVYDDALESDEDEIDETPYFDPDRIGVNKYQSLNRLVQEQEEEEQVKIAPKRSFREIQDMLKQRAEMNRGKTTDQLVAEDAGDDDLDLDLDLPPVNALRKRRDTFVDDDNEDQVMGGQEGFSISRSRSLRANGSISASTDHINVRKRTLESYASYVQEESQVTRRVGGGASGVSVIRPQNSGPSRSGSLTNTSRPAPVPHPHRQSTGGSHGSASGSGSVLLSKGNKFA